MRYFFSVDYANNPISIYRFDGKTHTEQIWGKESFSWKQTDTVSKWLALGDGWLDEVDENTAKESFPEAFQEVM